MKSIIGGLFVAALLCGATGAYAICPLNPDDCYCGDGLCRNPENTTDCPEDCYCGNHRCDLGEDGSTCGQECCDFNTPCLQYKDNGSTYLCRRWSTNNGATFTSYAWWSIPNYNSTYCSQQSQVCVVQSNCHNTYAICVHTTGDTGRFEILPTPSCP